MTEHESPCPALQVLNERVENLKGETEEVKKDMNGISEKLTLKLDTLNDNLGTIVTKNEEVRTDLKVSNRNMIITVLVSVLLLLAGMLANFLKPNGSAHATVKTQGVEAPK